MVLNNSQSHGDEEGNRSGSPQAHGEAGRENRLATESSPYLLLHARNPIDWYPWGPEALEKARKENKPIFLSIGYSSCYWCHVMERQTFSDEEVAEYMNQHFVCIKVDREERPDIDDIYMTSLIVYQQLSGAGGGGGWPLSVFLTPSAEPIAGATYMPPRDTDDGRTGFLTAAGRVRSLWAERPEDLTRTAGMIASQVRRLSAEAAAEADAAQPDSSLTESVRDSIVALYDEEHGGVDLGRTNRSGPRFFNAPRLAFLLDLYEVGGNEELLRIVTHSLTAFARGGVRDHLAGGFHRYSTDRIWLIPHFEKMLYDQAMLLRVFARAAALTGNAELREVAGETADFVRERMTTPAGGFCSAWDAETHAVEGAYYVWSADELQSVFTDEDDFRVFSTVYGANGQSPFEHGYILHLPQDLGAAANQLNMTEPDLRQRLESLKARLLQARDRREAPLLDDKVLAAWNGMMIEALATSGRLLNRPEDVDAAVRAAELVLSRMTREDGRLMRSLRNNDVRYTAYHDDYAFLTAGFLALHEADPDPRWLEQASHLEREQRRLFLDESRSAWYFTANDQEDLMARTSSPFDSVFPASNAVAAQNLIRLAEYQTTDRAERLQLADAVLRRFAGAVDRSPASCSGLASAVLLRLIMAEEAAAAEPQSEVPDKNDDAVSVSVFRPISTQESGGRSGNTGDSVRTTDTASEPPASDADSAAKKEWKPVAVKVYPLFDRLIRGRRSIIAVELTIDEEWHINPNPAPDEFLLPTELLLESRQKVRIVRVKYPAPKKVREPLTGEEQQWYQGRKMLYALIETDEAEPAAAAEMTFTLSFQACRNGQCRLPESVSMSGRMAIVPEGTTVREINRDKLPPRPASGRSATEGPAASSNGAAGNSD